jgi:hypothetical protein
MSMTRYSKEELRVYFGVVDEEDIKSLQGFLNLFCIPHAFTKYGHFFIN